MKSERISPFWVGGYQPFSAEKAKVSEKTVPNWVSFLKEKLQQ